MLLLVRSVVVVAVVVTVDVAVVVAVVVAVAVALFVVCCWMTFQCYNFSQTQKLQSLYCAQVGVYDTPEKNKITNVDL